MDDLEHLGLPSFMMEEEEEEDEDEEEEEEEDDDETDDEVDESVLVVVPSGPLRVPNPLLLPLDPDTPQRSLPAVLPREVTSHIFRFLIRVDLLSVTRASFRWKQVVHSDVGLINEMYNNASSQDTEGWESLGSPEFSLPDPLLRWLCASPFLWRPLATQRVMVAPFASGIDAMICCQPVAGVTSGAVIAALWRAATLRQPQHLVVLCPPESLPSALEAVRRIVYSMPRVEDEKACLLKIVRGPRDRLGLKFVEGTLILKSVNKKRIAHSQGAARFIGRTLTHVNGYPVDTLEEVTKLVAGRTMFTLKFEPHAIAAGLWWDHTTQSCGGAVNGIPFTVAMLGVDNAAAAQLALPGVSALTLRFRGTSDARKQGTWCLRHCLGNRKKRWQPRRWNDDEAEALLPDKPEVSEVTIRHAQSERLGLKFIDGTLVLKSVNPRFMAHKNGVAKFTGRKLTHVNGKPVSNLKEVKDALVPKTTLVTVEQADRTADAASKIITPLLNTDTPPTAVFSSSTGFHCPVKLRSPIRAHIPPSSGHFYMFSDTLTQQLHVIDTILSEILLPSVLVCCPDGEEEAIASSIGGCPIMSSLPPDGERIFVAGVSSIRISPRAAMVVILQTKLLSCTEFEALYTQASLRSGDCGAQGASLLLLRKESAADHLAILGDMGVTSQQLDGNDLIPSIREFVEPSFSFSPPTEGNDARRS